MNAWLIILSIIGTIWAIGTFMVAAVSILEWTVSHDPRWALRALTAYAWPHWAYRGLRKMIQSAKESDDQ